jgi:acetyl esterase/lipase
VNKNKISLIEKIQSTRHPVIHGIFCLVLICGATGVNQLAFARGDAVIKNETTGLSKVDYPSVEANVPYAKVADLAYLPWHKKIDYGNADNSSMVENVSENNSDAANSQYILYWSGITNRTGLHLVSHPTNASTNTSVRQASNHALIFIHGGCWLSQYSIDHSLAFTSALSQEGFDVYSIEYRRSGNGGEWPVALADIMQAMTSINKDMTERWGDNKFEISLLGHSAGGHLATLAAVELSTNKTQAKGFIPNKVHLFGLAPIIDLVSYAKGDNSCQKAGPAFMNGTPQQRQAQYAQANPLEYSLSNISTKVMFVGENDAIVPNLMAVHPDADTKIGLGAGHFDWIHPGSNAFKQLLNELKLTTKK